MKVNGAFKRKNLSSKENPEAHYTFGWGWTIKNYSRKIANCKGCVPIYPQIFDKKKFTTFLKKKKSLSGPKISLRCFFQIPLFYSRHLSEGEFSCRYYLSFIITNRFWLKINNNDNNNTLFSHNVYPPISTLKVGNKRICTVVHPKTNLILKI